jgi:hypothetical protein
MLQSRHQQTGVTMKSEAKANESLAYAVEAFQAEQAAWAKKLAASDRTLRARSAPVKVARPVVKTVKVGFFNRLFGV